MKIKFGKEILKDGHGYTISVNPGIECLGVICVLSDFELNVARTNKKYLASIRGYFYSYKDHPVVEKFKELFTNEAFRYDAPVEFFLNVFYNEKPSKELLERMNVSVKEYKEICKLVKDFVSVSEFSKFVEKNRKYYRTNMEKFYNDLSKYNPSRYLFDFLGEDHPFLNVVLMFGVTTSNYGIKIKDSMFCCIRPYKESRYQNEIDYAFNYPYITTLILHEFAHSFINPMTEEYRKEILKINKDNFKEIFAKNPYGEHVETAINELVIRAIECEYIKDVFKQEYYSFKKDYVEDGFRMITDIENMYHEFLMNRNKYKTFRDFYPNVMDYFLDME